MSRERRGGARLDRGNSPKRNAQKGSSSSRLEGGGERGAKKPLSRGAKIAILVAVAILAVFFTLFAIYKNWARLPALPDLPGQDVTADPVTGLMPSNVPEGSKRKKEFYTFLVVGRDTGGGGNTDTLMLASYDVPNQKLSVMSIPRDTMVDARHPGNNKKINAVWNLSRYYADKNNKREGVEYLKEAIGDMMGVTPDFHVIVNWEAFGRLVDAIGGVDFEVPFKMEYKDPTQNLVINQPAGFRHLSGDDAMQVVRWRHNNSYSVQYADADLGRIRTQQALMKEIVKKCLKIENITKINEFAKIFTEEVETNLSLGNLVAFAERAVFGGLKMDNVNFTTLPVSGVYVKGTSYVQAKPEELLGILNDSFNPYTEPLNMERLNVLQYSAAKGYYRYKGTGTGVAPVHTDSPTPKPTKTPKPTDAATKTPAPSATPTASGAATASPKNSKSPGSSQRPSEHATNTPKPSDHTSQPTSKTPEPTNTPEQVSNSPASTGNTPTPTPEPSQAAATPKPTAPPPPASSVPAPSAGLGIPLD